MAVLGDRATGVLDMLIDGLRREGQNIATPNMSAVAPTQLQYALNRPETTLGAYGTMTTQTPMGSVTYQANQNPLIADLTRGRILDVNDPMRQMPQPMSVEQATDRELSRRPVQKLAEDASKVTDVLAKNPQLEQDPTIVQKIQETFGGRENMLRLAMAFNTMRLQPDAGLATALSSELKDVRATRAARDQQNRTAAYFDAIDPKIAAAIRGGLSAKDAIALYRDRERGVVVGKMIVNPSTGDIIYDGSGEGSELPATYRALELRAEAAGLQKGTDAYRQFMLNAGQRQGLSIKVNEDGSFEITEGGAPSKSKALTEGQSKALAFSERMEASQAILANVEQAGTDIFDAIVSQLPIGANLLTSPEYKIYDQAKRDFVNAVLRFESGAAIGKDEFTNAEIQYFPRPGDTPQVIANKRRNRELAIAVMKSAAGTQRKQYSDQIKVSIYGPEALDWPEVGTMYDHPSKPGVKLRYIGGDPNDDKNLVEVK